MNKKIIAILIAVMLLIASAVVITSCNKDDETPTTTNPTTEDVQSTDENVSDDVTEDISKNESTSDNKIDKDENTTGVESKPPVKVEPSTDKNEPETCETCGKVIVSDSYKGDMLIGDYCDGMCDEWYGEMEF